MSIRMTLTEAPPDIPLELAAVAGREFGERLRRLGVDLGSRLVRSGEGVAAPSVRIQMLGPEAGAMREIVLGGEMAARVMVHLDDDRKLPLPELQTGEEGHVEGLVSDTVAAQTLMRLGLQENDRIRMTRKLPPMRFATMVHEHGRTARVGLSDGQAAMILGRFDEAEPAASRQFAMARGKSAFFVDEVLGDSQMVSSLTNLGVLSGSRLILREVLPSQQVSLAGHASIRLVTQEGLTLLLHPHDAEKMTVIVCGQSA